MKTFKMLGKRWRLLFVPALGAGGKGTDGRLDAPDTKNKTMWIRSDLRGSDLLDTLIHEALHAADWTKDEEYVTQVANDLTTFLWSLGYRREGE